MKDQITYAGLLALERDINMQMELSPAFRLFNREKVRRFATQNQHRLSVLHSTMDKLIDKYVKKGPDGKPMTQDVGERQEYVFESEQIKEQYKKEWADFMQITFDLHV